ncbi:unnamed protein product [Sphagnum balticum]
MDRGEWGGEADSAPHSGHDSALCDCPGRYCRGRHYFQCAAHRGVDEAGAETSAVGYFSVIQQVHPRIITEGYEIARKEALKFLETFKVVKDPVEKPLLISVARTALCTKLHPELANQLVDIVVDAVNIIRIPDKPIDLHMIEIMHMVHRLSSDTQLVKGLVLDHGARNPDMPKRL